MVFWRKKKVENQGASHLDQSTDKSLENNGNEPSGLTPSNDAGEEKVSWYRRALAKRTNGCGLIFAISGKAKANLSTISF